MKSKNIKDYNELHIILSLSTKKVISLKKAGLLALGFSYSLHLPAYMIISSGILHVSSRLQRRARVRF